MATVRRHKSFCLVRSAINPEHDSVKIQCVPELLSNYQRHKIFLESMQYFAGINCILSEWGALWVNQSGRIKQLCVLLPAMPTCL